VGRTLMKAGGYGAVISRSPLDRATFLRHLAISAASLAAFAMRRELHVSGRVLWVLGLAAVANVTTARCLDIPRFARVARGVSPVLGIAGWAALVSLTGGSASPMVAGFCLEVVFSALVFPPGGTLLVTGGVVAAMWLIEIARAGGIGAGCELSRLGLQTGFVVTVGSLTFFASRRWQKENAVLAVETAAFSVRLRSLERELEGARALGQVGERTARLAHGLKNSVHSLRGLTRLIETPDVGSSARRQALEGLRHAIDRLEETVRTALRPSTADHGPRGTTTAFDLTRTLDEVIDEVARDHAGVRWVKPASDRLTGVALSSTALHEVLLILARNAAEACGETGEIVLRAGVEGNAFRLDVEDQGPGIDPVLWDGPGRPGMTTKSSGSGFGLFLARRLVESGGGKLTVGKAPDGGARVSLRLPVIPGG
jgi:signal transduction histidine kinase